MGYYRVVCLCEDRPPVGKGNRPGEISDRCRRMRSVNGTALLYPVLHETQAHLFEINELASDLCEDLPFSTKLALDKMGLRYRISGTGEGAVREKDSLTWCGGCLFYLWDALGTIGLSGGREWE